MTAFDEERTLPFRLFLGLGLGPREFVLSQRYQLSEPFRVFNLVLDKKSEFCTGVGRRLNNFTNKLSAGIRRFYE